MWRLRCSPAPSGSCRGNRLGREGREQERTEEAAGLDQKESHDLAAAIEVGVEALKRLIQEDRAASR